MDEERALVRRALAGEEEAFAGLVRAFQTPVYNLCYRMLGTAMEAEEAAQETFLRAYRRLHTYDAAQKLSSWMLAIAAHYCVDRLRRRRMPCLPMEEAPASALQAQGVEGAPEQDLLEREREHEIQVLLARLPETYRMVIVLRYWQDMSYEEMAQMLGTTESAIKSRLHRARELLAVHLARERSAPMPGRLERSVAGHALP
ncbi:MAG: sigma-70 family RNA polymerase sigma factor [Anaerolineae bacterium]|nr:sigma-70 family RNA polymerase sigma factor [Anaerolineae bacterium]